MHRAGRPPIDRQSTVKRGKIIFAFVRVYFEKKKTYLEEIQIKATFKLLVCMWKGRPSQHCPWKKVLSAGPRGEVPIWSDHTDPVSKIGPRRTVDRVLPPIGGFSAHRRPCTTAKTADNFTQVSFRIEFTTYNSSRKWGGLTPNLEAS